MLKNPDQRSRRSLQRILMGALPLGLLSPSAFAGSTSAGDEFLSSIEGVPPVIIFVLDMHLDMDETCGERLDSGASDSAVTQTCLEMALDAIDQVTQHYDWANFGVIGTTDSASDNGFYEIAPVGSSHSDIAAALDDISSSHGVEVRNLSEAISSAASDYLSNTASSHSDAWSVAPIEYDCQQVHFITITSGPPEEDSGPSHSTSTGMPRDVLCDSDYNYGASVTDEWCLYDNVAYNLYENFDARTDLSDDQNALVHTIALRVDGSSLSEDLYGSASEASDGDGMYLVANEGDEIVAKMMYILSDIRAGHYSRSAPIITADGSYLIYSFYEIAGLTGPSDEQGSPLGQGHVRAYTIDEDGSLPMDGDSQFGGAVWDAGDLLVSRPVLASETNPDLPDGFGQRNIFTFITDVAEVAGSSNSVWSERYPAGTNSDARMDFDADFVDAVDSFSLLSTFLDTSSTKHDFDDDDDVDTDDLQYLVDFARGLPSATFRYLDQERGYWKLGDSPHATPVVVTARNNSYSADPTYRRFLKALEDGHDDNPELYPDIVLIPANDGMLHAFALEDYLDRPSSSLSTDEDDEQAGEELWAWMLSYILYADESEDWSGRLVDLMLYGRTFLFDGSPVVEDVWIDMDGDENKECSLTNFPTDCEWRRVVVVQQGKGGPSTLALDITIPAQPRFLWEHLGPDYYDTNGGIVDPSAMGYTTSRPVITNLYDKSSSPAHDRWTAIWGSGRAVPRSTSTSYYASSEANLYFWHISEDYIGDFDDGVTFDRRGSNDHPQATGSLDTDSDGRYEYGYISGALAAVDVDSDGDSDVLYFPVTAAYEPSDMGDVDGDGSTGRSDLSDPGYTWMYKAVIDTSDLDDPEWCEFVDPSDYVGDYRPEVYYAATTSWHNDGSLGIYWGSGSPYDRSNYSDPGFLFGFIDEAPTTCPATATPICTGGYKEMDDGEGLTGDPLAYQGVVYFPTYTPNEDRCEDGVGRVRGMAYDDCSSGIDTTGDGEPDADYVELDGYPSSLTVTDQGDVIWGSSSIGDGTDIISSTGSLSDPFKGTQTMMLREVF